jgi:hypothetical protein
MSRMLLVLIAAGTLATSIADTASAQQLVQRRDVSYALALAIATGAVDACRALGFAKACPVPFGIGTCFRLRQRGPGQGEGGAAVGRGGAPPWQARSCRDVIRIPD